MSDTPKCAMFSNGDGTVTILPFRAGCDPLKDGLLESVDGSKVTTIPLRLRAPMPTEFLGDEILDHKGRPLTA